MTHPIPPELMAPEDREMRAAGLERLIGREWLRYAVTEAALVFAPFMVVLLLYAFEAISYSVVVVAIVAAMIAVGALLAYWLLVRMGPLRHELESLRAVP